MAPGYVVAAILDAAGLIGVVIAVLRIRTERSAKAIDLRSFLVSGQTASTVPAQPRRRGVYEARIVATPFVPGQAAPGAGPESPARLALARALPRPAGKPGPPTPLTAG